MSLSANILQRTRHIGIGPVFEPHPSRRRTRPERRSEKLRSELYETIAVLNLSFQFSQCRQRVLVAMATDEDPCQPIFKRPRTIVRGFMVLIFHSILNQFWCSGKKVTIAKRTPTFRNRLLQDTRKLGLHVVVS